jgi:hypothetical protein
VQKKKTGRRFSMSRGFHFHHAPGGPFYLFGFIFAVPANMRFEHKGVCAGQLRQEASES